MHEIFSVHLSMYYHLIFRHEALRYVQQVEVIALTLLSDLKWYHAMTLSLYFFVSSCRWTHCSSSSSSTSSSWIACLCERRWLVKSGLTIALAPPLHQTERPRRALRPRCSVLWRAQNRSLILLDVSQQRVTVIIPSWSMQGFYIFKLKAHVLWCVTRGSIFVPLFDQQNWDDQAHLSFVQSHLAEILELLVDPSQLSQSGQAQRDCQVCSQLAQIPCWVTATIYA